MLAAISWRVGLRILSEFKEKYQQTPENEISSILRLRGTHLSWNSMKLSLRNNATLAAKIWHLPLRSIWKNWFFLVVYTTNNKFYKFEIHVLSRRKVILHPIQEVKAEF